MPFLPELKHHHTFNQGQDLTSANSSTGWGNAQYVMGSPQTLFCPRLGTSNSERVGNRVFVHRIRIMGMIANAATSDINTLYSAFIGRLVLVLDKTPNGDLPNASFIIGDVNGVPNVAFWSQQNPAFVSRFDILYDKLHYANHWNTFGSATQFSYGPVCLPFEIDYLFDDPLVVNFYPTVSTTGTVDDLSTSNLILLCGMSSVSGNMRPRIQFNSLVNFYEY